MKRHNKRSRGRRLASQPTRKGSTLIIVLALLGLLTMLGLVFFTFANQERTSAEYFTEAAKGEPDPADNGVAFGVERLLMGARENERNSSLFGRAGIVNRGYGNDSRHGNGTGVNVIYYDPPGGAVEWIPVVDQNRDGLPDSASPNSVNRLINIVDSPAAHGGRYRDKTAMPSPDNGVTYPDQNAPFLSYRGYALRDVGGTLTMVPVLIPSFMRPGLMRQGTDLSVTDPDWFDDAGNDYVQRGYRPHRAHVYVTRDGQTIDDGSGNPVLRFIDVGDPDVPGSGPFPFTPVDDSGSPYDQDSDAVFGEMGIFTATPAEISDPMFDPLVYELDVDTDNDDIRDSIWVDLDHPVLEDPATGRKYTYLYAISVKDMEALINLSAHGNLAGDLQDWSAFVGGVEPDAPAVTASLSRSNGGITPSEVNPNYALRRAIDPAEAYEQYEAMYSRRPQNPIEQANMDWFWLMMGRPDLDAASMIGASRAALLANVNDSEIRDMFSGRFGEPERLYYALTQTSNLGAFLGAAPKPGRALQDDNNDVLEGAPGRGMRGTTGPMDYVGSGRWVGANPRFPSLRSIAGQAVLTPQYLGYSIFNNNLATPPPLGPNQLHYLGEDGTWGTADDLIIQRANYAYINVLFDDMNEGIVELEEAIRPADGIQGGSATLNVQMSDRDIAASGDETNPIFRDLAPYAMARKEVRERFTASSWGLREHSIAVPFPPRVLNPFGNDGQPGWAGVDDDGDTVIDEFDEIGTFNPASHTYSEDGFRAWMFSADTALFDSNSNNIFQGNNRFEFPPRFGQALPFMSRELGNAGVGASGKLSEDPFRAQLRRLLRVEVGDRRQTFGQLPLNINRFLDVERLPNRQANLLRGILEYRSLTEHVDSVNSDGSTATNTLQNSAITPCPYPPNDATGNSNGTVLDEMEYWARRDRQKMARDIYVLLYTLGGGNDTVNYAGSNLSVTSAPPATPPVPPNSGSYKFYTPAQLRQMAQFAVNMVDALDRDNVITKFEYDKNLGDTFESGSTDVLHSGWNLDDDPSTDDAFAAIPSTFTAVDGLSGGFDGHYPEDSFERGVVYGVEQQELAFTETMAVFSAELSSDNTLTLYDDSTEAHAFLHIELQNLTTSNVPLATPESTNDARAIYRLRAFNEDTPGTDNPNNHRTLAFLNGAPDADPGDVYTIGTSAGNDQNTGHRPSDFYVDHDADGNYDRITPAHDATNLPTSGSLPTDPQLQPRSTIDLVHERDRVGTPEFSVNGAGIGTEGDFLTASRGGVTMFDPATGATANQVLVLERRANPHMPSLPLSENPWVEVDRTFIQFSEFRIQTSTTQVEVGALLANLIPIARSQPLQALAALPTAPPAPPSVQTNSIGLENDTSYTLTQAHYDRDFTSIGELLHLPLYGPGSVTTELSDSRAVPRQGSNGQDVDARANRSGPIGGASSEIDGNPTSTMPPIRTYGGGRPNNQALVSGANAKFLLADFPDGSPRPTGVTAQDLDNRWYQLFGALEVATRTHRQLGNPLVNLKRVPGKINWNTLRHPEVLAGALDDRTVFDLDPAALSETAIDHNPLPSSLGDTRDWMQQLLASRDGGFTAPGTSHTLYIPGLPGSRPFKPFGRTLGTNFSLVGLNRSAAANSGVSTGVDLDDTFLRTLPQDFADPDGDYRNNNSGGRRLFEVGTTADFNGTSGFSPSMTPQTRHRLLAKMLNNATTTSHTFVVHMTIGRFEVVEGANGSVRIGGEYDITPSDGNPASFNRHRTVFLIDRSEASEAFDAGSGQFDWRRLIKQQVDIQ